VLFEQFWQWLSDRLADYVSVNVAAVAAAIEPAAVSLAAIYVMAWGFLHLKGAVEEPVLTGAMRIVRLVVVIGVGLRLWQYNAVIVDTFFEAPMQLAAALAGAADPIGTIDALWDRGGTVAGFLWEKGGVFNGDVGYYIAAVIVYLLMGAVCVYTLFLMSLARVALAVLLAIGPLFIVLLLFDGTKRFFEAWIAQLANYALVGVLAVLTATLLMTVVEAYAVQTAAKGAAILTVDALDMLLVAGLVLLILRQVMPIAARLAGGVALASHGVMGAAAARGLGMARNGGAYAGRSALDRAALGYEAWRSGRVASLAQTSAPGQTTVTTLAAATKVTPAWRPVRGG
jgi:type IV secretion system protein VirB6